MVKSSDSQNEKRNTHLARTLRDFMMKSPKTGVPVTLKELADYLGVRPQTVALYRSGESLPNSEQILKIAKFFDVTTDYMITGLTVENKPIREQLGLSESTIQNMRLVNDGYFEDCPYMLPMLDGLLGNKDFYLALESAANFQQEAEAEQDASLREFYSWKAAQILSSFLLDFLNHNIQAIYRERKEREAD